MMTPQTIATLPIWLAALRLVGAALLYSALVATLAHWLVPLQVGNLFEKLAEALQNGCVGLKRPTWAGSAFQTCRS